MNLFKCENAGKSLLMETFFEFFRKNSQKSRLRSFANERKEKRKRLILFWQSFLNYKLHLLFMK